MGSKVTKLDSKTVKPCPFCGSEEICMKEGKTIMIECQKCMAVMFNYVDGVKRDVIAIWNRRAEVRGETK